MISSIFSVCPSTFFTSKGMRTMIFRTISWTNTKNIWLMPNEKRFEINNLVYFYPLYAHDEKHEISREVQHYKNKIDILISYNPLSNFDNTLHYKTHEIINPPGPQNPKYLDILNPSLSFLVIFIILISLNIIILCSSLDKCSGLTRRCKRNIVMPL